MEAWTDKSLNERFGGSCASQEDLYTGWIVYIDARRAKANHSHCHGTVDTMSLRTRWQMGSRGVRESFNDPRFGVEVTHP